MGYGFFCGHCRRLAHSGCPFRKHTITSGHIYLEYDDPVKFFVFMVLLLSKIVTLLEYERKIARTDYLTGALSSRFFYDVLQMEINRSQI